MSRRPCHRTHDHPAHLWLQNRQRMECPGVGGNTGVVCVDTNDEALRDRLVAVIEASECIEKPEHDNTDGWGLCAICEANAILAALRIIAAPREAR